MSGDVSVTTADGRKLTAAEAANVRLGPGSRVNTGADGRVTLTLPDGLKIELGPRAEFVVGEPATPDESVIDFLSGRLRAFTSGAQQLAARSHRYKVRTPTAVVGVRGTDFTVDVRANRSGSITVREGSIELFTPDTRRSIAILSAGNRIAWDDSLRITALGPTIPAVAVAAPPRRSVGDRASAVWSSTASLGREYGLIAAVLTLLALFIAQLASNRRKPAAKARTD